MLDVQRYRGAIHLEEIQFTRKWMWLHMILGAVMIAMFLFHEIFRWFAGAVVWYAISLMVMYGFMNGKSLFKWLLALVYLGGAGAGALIPHAVIPIWVGVGSLTYVVSALFLLCSSRVGKAAKTGFTLW
jgi:hypothetical protein